MKVFTKLRCILLLFIVIVTYTKFTCAENSNIFDFEQIKNDLFFKSNQLSSLNMEKYRNCSIELNAIQNGLKSFEKWAFKLVDAWGKVPSGLLSGNLFEFEDFSQCFHIERDEQTYDTQYCVGQVSFNSKELNTLMDSSLFIKPPSNFPSMIVPGPGFSFGMCLPSACSINHIETLLNGLNRTKVRGFSISIPKESCQHEESASDFGIMDYVTMYLLLAVSILVAASTSYDVLYTMQNKKKFPPFLMFSFYTNGKKLLSFQKSDSPDTMGCLHGIRAISSQWIVFGHVCLTYGMFPVKNRATLLTFVAEPRSMIIASGPIAVDTFLVMSGILVSLSILKTLEKYGKINIGKLYLHRYLRLTPLLTVTFLVSMTLLRFMGDGPLWTMTIDFLSKHCHQYWWSTLFYVQNYVNPTDICLMHTWYLSVDMQLFVIAPLIVYLIFRFRAKTIFALTLLILCCIWWTLFVHAKYELKSLREEGKLEVAYFPTHIRYSSWLIGVIGGYILFETRKKPFHIPKMWNLIGWTLSGVFMFLAIFANYPLQQLDTKAHPIEFGLYDALSRVGWSIAHFYVIFACVNNAGGFVNSFLSHSLWQPISRISYSIYLLHVPIITVMYASAKTTRVFSELATIQNFIAVNLVTILASIVATLAFESPIVTLDKILFSSATKTEPNESTQQIKSNKQKAL